MKKLYKHFPAVVVYLMKKALQIVFVGFEWDRLIYGLREYPPKKAVIVTNDPATTPNKKWAERTSEVADRLIKEISPLIETELVLVDYHNVESASAKIIEIIEGHIDEYDDITINVSSGTKPLIISAVLASQYYPVSLFYVIPQDYNVPEGEVFLTKGARKAIQLPSLEMKELVMPTKMQKKIFREIEDGEISFTKLVKKYAKSNEIRLDEDSMKRTKCLFSYHLKKLKSKKLVKLNQSNRQLFISLTDTGKFVSKIIEMQEKKAEIQKTGQVKLRLKGSRLRIAAKS